MAMGGVGEAMLLGAAMGGGSAALTGGDPLKGALMGGLTGGIGGGISTALGTAGTTAGTLTGSGLTMGASAAPSLTAGTAGSTLGGNLGSSLAGFEPLTAVAPSTATNIATAANPGITTLANGLPTSTANQILSKVAPGNVVPSTAVTTAAAPSGAANTPLLNSADVGNFAPSNYSFGKPVDFPNVNYSLAKSASAPVTATPAAPQTFAEGMKKFVDSPLQSIKDNPITAFSSAYKGATAGRKKEEEEEEYSGPLSRFKFNPDKYRPSGYADGGIANLYSGGYDQMVGEEPMYMSNMAAGGIANLGSYSDGGRMLKGPGDGMSDSIPASISGKRPARLADGEFVVPADVVSHLGNGSTDAGAKQLYAMMNKVRQARTGRKAQGREINPRQYVPA